jgi:hypothetical protein
LDIPTPYQADFEEGLELTQSGEGAGPVVHDNIHNKRKSEDCLIIRVEI